MKKRRKTAPFLGAFKLNWCDSCNIPILDKRTCDLCHGAARKVIIAPPGDVHPAFKGDLIRFSKIINKAFGKGSAKALGLSTKKIVLVNEGSFDDLMEEVIIDGQVMGSFRYELARKCWDFHPKFVGAQRLFEGRKAKRRYVIVDESAVKYIEKGYNVLSPGVLKVDPQLKIGDSAVALSPKGKVLSVGIMKINGKDFDRTKKGVVLKPKFYCRNSPPAPLGNSRSKNQNWPAVIRANSAILDNYEQGALQSIMRVYNKHPHLVPSVSFSGGKDSLVCLQLANKIPNFNFKVLFVNTSLEFPETLEYIEKVIEKMGLRERFCRKDIPEEIFWQAIRNYGPPGKDYRFCCKLLKIGPVNELIDDCIGKKSLSLVGQRAYESIARAQSKKLWENPWIPNQLNFSPIQKWTALHIWLYIFREKLYYNPLYEKGFSRIGCWLCPASTQGTFEIIKNVKPTLWKKWSAFLKEWQKRNKFPPEWLSWGLWRWKKLPKKMLDLAERYKVDLSAITKSASKNIGEWELGFTLQEGFATCKSGGVVLDGAFSMPLSLSRIKPFWEIFGKADLDEELGLLTLTTPAGEVVTMSADGAITAKGKTIKGVKTALKNLVLEVFRTEDCTGCKVCLSHCTAHALFINPTTNQIELLAEECTHCANCHYRCPVIKFGHREIEELFSEENNS
ncbi:MAG: phosphoadenosine phosphosulfate reductase family protein [Candidatus Heimdallarchaeota archaeon]|nr:phosphoadenosine phosphosulfate reductase family protein [Candidatus Heimdallarchaeota archaeon]